MILKPFVYCPAFRWFRVSQPLPLRSPTAIPTRNHVNTIALVLASLSLCLSLWVESPSALSSKITAGPKTGVDTLRTLYAGRSSVNLRSLD